MKYDWQKICDEFAKELKQFLEKNRYEKFALSKNLDHPNSNVDFLIHFCKLNNIPLVSSIVELDYLDKYSDYNKDYIFQVKEVATICPIIRSEFFIKHYWRTEFLLSIIHPLIWAFESDIKEMSKIIGFDYVPFPFYAGNFTGDQLEWIEMQDINYKVITGETDPSKNPRWLGYTADQRELVAKAYSLYLENKNNFQSGVQINSSKFKQ